MLSNNLSRVIFVRASRPSPQLNKTALTMLMQQTPYFMFKTANATLEGMNGGGPRSVTEVNFQPEDLVALRMRGLPWRVEPDEIESFFSKYGLVKDSIRLGELADGRKTGQAAVLFENSEEAKNAMNEKQGQNVGSRWVELYQIPYSQYVKFMDDQLTQKTVLLKNYLNEDNVLRCVKLRGIPYQASEQDVREFFSGYDLNESDIVLEQRQGKKTGFALVFLSSEDEVQRAIAELNKQYIGSRFIDLMTPRLGE